MRQPRFFATRSSRGSGLTITGSATASSAEDPCTSRCRTSPLRARSRAPPRGVSCARSCRCRSRAETTKRPVKMPRASTSSSLATTCGMPRRRARGCAAYGEAPVTTRGDRALAVELDGAAPQVADVRLDVAPEPVVAARGHRHLGGALELQRGPRRHRRRVDHAERVLRDQ